VSGTQFSDGSSKEMIAIGRKKIAALAIAVVVAIAVTIAIVGWRGTRPSEQTIPADLADALTVRVTPLVEAKLSTDWSAGTDRQRVACAVRPFGTEPAAADTMTQVQTVYVRALCAAAGNGVRSETSLPMVVHLTPVVRIDAPTEVDAAAQVDRLFPQRLHAQVTSGQQAVGLEPALDARIREITGATR
jgi:hypothetical protein